MLNFIDCELIASYVTQITRYIFCAYEADAEGAKSMADTIIS